MNEWLQSGRRKHIANGRMRIDLHGDRSGIGSSRISRKIKQAFTGQLPLPSIDPVRTTTESVGLRRKRESSLV